MNSLNESIVENAAREWFRELGYEVGHGPQLASAEPATESACALHADRRNSFSGVVRRRLLRLSFLESKLEALS